MDRWLPDLDTYGTRQIHEVDAVPGRLRENLPDTGPDWRHARRLQHVQRDLLRGVPAHLAATLDWDTATIGEPLMGLGHLLAWWDEAEEEPTMLGSADNPDRAGLASRAELAVRYAERTGFDLTHLRCYEVRSLFKLACIMEGHYANAVSHGDSSGGRFTTMSLDIIRDGARIARGERT